MGYLLIIAVSVGVGVLVYRLTEGGHTPEEAREAPAPPPTNFERLSISHDRLTWHDRMIGTFGLIVAVAIAAAALAFGLYLAGSALIGLLEKAAS